MFTIAGHYKLNGKEIWVEEKKEWGGLYYWTALGGWEPLTDDMEKYIVYHRK